jgi:hypothetical protein
LNILWLLVGVVAQEPVAVLVAVVVLVDLEQPQDLV